MQRVVLVHGSVVGGRSTWGAQRRGLADRFDVVVVERPGSPAGPPAQRVDFEHQAPWLADLVRPGDHLVGHSYGGVVCMLAAVAAADRLRSLTLVEAPATRVARDNPAVAAFERAGAELWANGPRDDPEAFLRAFLRGVGSDFDPPSPLTPDLRQGARALLVERGPWEAEIPVAALAATPFPKLVVSGAHHPAFDAICDALERQLGAERAVFPGFGHMPQLHPGFNDRLAGFVERAATT